MAVSATVTAGKIFADGETVTISELNKLGTPTVDISGAVGTLALQDGSVTNVKVSSTAAIQHDKLANTSSSGQILMGNSSNVVTNTTMTGDVTITDAGVTAIGSSKVTDGMLEGDITEAKLIAAVTAKLLPPGVITPYVKSGAEPTGWKYCDGGHYDSTDAAYTALYDIIGYVYGRTDSAGADDASGTYFKVPDLRGRVPVGVDGTAGRLAADDTLAAAGGAENVTLTQNQIPAHTHSNSLTNGETTSTVSDNSTVDDYGTPWSHDSTDVQVIPNDPYSPHDSWRMAEIYSGGSWDVQPEDSQGVDRPYLNMRADKDWNHYFEVKNTSNVSITNGNNSTTGASVSLTQPYQVVEYIIKL